MSQVPVAPGRSSPPSAHSSLQCCQYKLLTLFESLTASKNALAEDMSDPPPSAPGSVPGSCSDLPCTLIQDLCPLPPTSNPGFSTHNLGLGSLKTLLLSRKGQLFLEQNEV